MPRVLGLALLRLYATLPTPLKDVSCCVRCVQGQCKKSLVSGTHENGKCLFCAKRRRPRSVPASRQARLALLLALLSGQQRWKPQCEHAVLAFLILARHSGKAGVSRSLTIPELIAGQACCLRQEVISFRHARGPRSRNSVVLDGGFVIAHLFK